MEGRGAAESDQRLHPRGRRSLFGAADRLGVARRRRRGRYRPTRRTAPATAASPSTSSSSTSSSAPSGSCARRTRRVRVPGVVVGLAYTPVGGSILFIEATDLSRPRQDHTHRPDWRCDEGICLGRPEPVQDPRPPSFHFDARGMAERDLHIHVPAGAVPKDGPSAGGALYNAIASLRLNLPVLPGVAMTGEMRCARPECSPSAA